MKWTKRKYADFLMATKQKITEKEALSKIQLLKLKKQRILEELTAQFGVSDLDPTRRIRWPDRHGAWFRLSSGVRLFLWWVKKSASSTGAFRVSELGSSPVPFLHYIIRFINCAMSCYDVTHRHRIIVLSISFSVTNSLWMYIFFSKKIKWSKRILTDCDLFSKVPS